MKKFIFLVAALVFITAGFSAYSQSYRTVADTAALNKEYLKVSSEIADLAVKLNKAQGDLPHYTKKADDATTNAQNTAMKTTDKASAATNGTVNDARKAKREAKKSIRDAKGSRKAGNNLDDQDKKITNLSGELAKKRDRLRELDVMRAAINNSPQ